MVTHLMASFKRYKSHEINYYGKIVINLYSVF